MRFGYAINFWWLAAIPLCIVLFAWAFARRARLAARFADLELWRMLSDSVSTRGRVWKAILIVLSLTALSLAASGPQWGARSVMLDRLGLDIVVAIDVSASMLAEDLKPNRLERAKREIIATLERLEGDRVGLVVFSGRAFVQCPLTLDMRALRLILDAVDVESAGRPGTAVAQAIQTAAAMFDPNQKQFKVVLLLSDGESHEGDALEAAERAAEDGVVIYAVGIGSPSGEPIPLYDEAGNPAGFKRDGSGGVILSRLDEVTLQKVALATGGRYLRAVAGQAELEVILDEIAALEKKELEGRLHTEFEERYRWLLVPAILMLVAESFIGERRRKSRRGGMVA